ncbi:hypothetical protein [Streptomyces sp. HB2AG]|uniref:hypothetical protein n=1 Tax=Streptomyces sp. HB2AG TaxID=2983400 RepID=UPI002E7C513E|nr:hypothetical protein [Streptomyces sp. HB2AG]
MTLACAVAAWLVEDPAGLRVLVAVGLATAVACVLWATRTAREAERKIHRITVARTRDEWRTEERIAELEIDLEEAREIRAGLERRLRAKRSELARLRGDHAALLRRYATAESERARALESSRTSATGPVADLVQSVAAGPVPQAPAGVHVPSTALVLRSGPATAAPAATAATAAPLDPAAFHRAADALRHMARNAARQQALRTVEEARRRDAEEQRHGDEPRGRHAQGSRPPAADRPALPVRTQRTGPAVAIVPAGHRADRERRPTPGGFDFFGLNKQAAGVGRDLADVVGDEAYAEHERSLGDEGRDRAHGADPEVIDLTAHDETEQIDVRPLRALS